MNFEYGDLLDGTLDGRVSKEMAEGMVVIVKSLFVTRIIGLRVPEGAFGMGVNLQLQAY